MTLMGRDFDAYEQAGRLVVQLEDRLLDLPPPSLFGAPPVRQRRPGGRRHPGVRRSAHRRGRRSAAACRARSWPGRFQALTKGPLGEGGEAARRRPLARRRPQPACRRGAGRDGGTAGGARRAARRADRRHAGPQGRVRLLPALQRRWPRASSPPRSTRPTPRRRKISPPRRAAAGLQAEAVDGVEAALTKALARPARRRTSSSAARCTSSATSWPCRRRRGRRSASPSARSSPRKR